MKTAAYAASTAGAPLAPITIDRRDCRDDDVVIDILFSGICHSDIHQARAEWGTAMFPMVPGHEIVGRVSRIGARVTKLAVGDLAGVGCMVDSCRACAPCREDHEQFCYQWCRRGPTTARRWISRRRRARRLRAAHRGASIALPLKVPAGLAPAAAAPLLCAGVTMYSPLRQFDCKAAIRN